jgi:hypothetical protein
MTRREQGTPPNHVAIYIYVYVIELLTHIYIYYNIHIIYRHIDLYMWDDEMIKHQKMVSSLYRYSTVTNSWRKKRFSRI